MDMSATTFGKITRAAFASGLAMALVLGLCPVAGAAHADGGSKGLVSATVADDNAPSMTLSPQASSAKSAKKTTRKSAAFTIKKYRKHKKYTYSVGEWRYGKPVLKGNSAVVKKINKSLNARYKKNNDSDRVLETAKSSDTSYYDNAVFRYVTDTRATYNKKGLISFCYSWDWWMGGVHNYADVGAVYSLKTGREVKLNQVMPGSATSIKKKIGKAIKKKYGDGIYSTTVSNTPSYATGLSKTKLSDISFYLEDGKVVVCFEPYRLYQGNFPMKFTFSGKY